MKKLLFAAFILPLAGSLFFSCKSSEIPADNLQDEEPLEKVEEIEEALADAAEEKIPQSEVDELDKLLSQNDEPQGEVDQSDKLLSQDGEPQNKGDREQEEVFQNEEGSKSQEIPQGGAAQAASEAEKPLAAERPATDQSQEPSGGQNSLTQKIRDSNSSVRAAPQSQGESKTDSSEGGGLERVTSQNKTIQGGPLIGPSSDKQNDGRDNTSERYDFSQRTEPQSQKAEEQSSNEGIALALPQENEEEEKPQEEKAKIPSRSMTIKNNQFLDVVYPGSGWIYLGEEDGGEHFIFQGRKLGNGETTFTLRSKNPGIALLHFYKNDILTGNYIDDYIQIEVSDKSAADAVHVTAPSYADAVPPKFDRTQNTSEKETAIEEAAAKKQAEREEIAKADEKSQALPSSAPQEENGREAESESSPSEKVQTVIQTSGLEKIESKQRTALAGSGQGQQSAGQENPAKKEESLSGGQKAKSLLERAQKAYDEKRYADALDLVQQFFETATEDFDAGLYLEGLILEAKSEVRNIKSAIGAYDTLIKNWPQSQYWRRANERSIYLKRFYIDIR